MKLKSILFILSIILISKPIIKAQSEILEQLKKLKPMVSTREDVEKFLGKGEDRENRTVYHNEKETVRITYSDSNCVEGWLAPEDTVIKIQIRFLDDRKLSELTKKIKLKKLRVSHAYDSAGEKMYHDDENGVEYNVNHFDKTWMSISYYPSNKYSQSKCKN